MEIRKRQICRSLTLKKNVAEEEGRKSPKSHAFGGFNRHRRKFCGDFPHQSVPAICHLFFAANIFSAPWERYDVAHKDEEDEGLIAH